MIVMVAIVFFVRLGRAAEFHENGRVLEEHAVFRRASATLQLAKPEAVFVRERRVAQARHDFAKYPASLVVGNLVGRVRDVQRLQAVRFGQHYDFP